MREAGLMVAARGLDISAHRPRQVTPEIIKRDGRDVILAMTKEHIRELTLLDIAAGRRAFTFPELLRRAAALPPEPGEELLAWVRRISEQRRGSELLGDGGPDDVPDPYGRADTLFDSVAAALAQECAAVAGMVRPG